MYNQFQLKAFTLIRLILTENNPLSVLIFSFTVLWRAMAHVADGFAIIKRINSSYTLS